MTVGERIRLQRQKLGMSVDELALKLNKNRATIYRYESDEIENLPLPILEPLAKILKVSPAYLMGWEDEKTYPNTYEIPEQFTNPDEAREYIKKHHKVFAADGFEIDKIDDEKILAFANALLEQIRLVGYKYTKR